MMWKGHNNYNAAKVVTVMSIEEHEFKKIDMDEEI